jgi:myo-inositol-1(or 4)-monophosphatase
MKQTPDLDFCVSMVRETGHFLLHTMSNNNLVAAKSSAIDLVTQADEQAQARLVGRIREAFPDHRIIAEEDHTQGAPHDIPHNDTWYIDPIDGTTNYWHGMPLFSISVAFCRHGEPEIGVVYLPYTNEIFYATRGGGTFDGKGPLRVSSVQTLEQALVATGFPYERAPGSDNNLVEFGRVMPMVQGIRRSGSAAIDLAFVAAGRYDGYWEFHVRPWDTMAGQLLVLEAGGQLSRVRPEGKMHGSGGILATNGHLHATLQRHIMGDP